MNILEFAAAFMVAGICAVSTTASAAEVITIGSDVDTNRKVTIAAFDPIGQSFTAATDTLSSFGFDFSTLNPTVVNSPLSFSLYAGETLTGTALFNTSFTLPDSINSRNVEQFFDIALPNLAVVRGNRYSAVLTASSNRAALLVGPGFNVQTGMLTGGDAYVGGQLLNTGNAVYPNCAGPADNCDANFRVTGAIATAAVPEPSTWALLMLGFAVVGGMLRRSKPDGVRVRYR